MRRRTFSVKETLEADPACPGCGVSLSWVRDGDLQRVHIRWRSPPGAARPIASELRCRSCNRRVIVLGKPGSLKLMYEQELTLSVLQEEQRLLADANFDSQVERTARNERRRR